MYKSTHTGQEIDNAIDAVATKANASDLLLKADISSVPTKTSQLQNDSGYITSASIPVIPSKTSDLTNDSNFITLVHAHNAENLNAINYSDITDTPVIPTKLSDLQNDTGFLNNTSEQKYITVTSDSVVFDYSTSIYKKTITAAATLAFDTTALTNLNSVATFELWLDIQAASLTLTFPALTWVGETPDFSTAGTYVVTIRFDGSKKIANLAYKLEAVSDAPGGSSSGDSGGNTGSL